MVDYPDLSQVRRVLVAKLRHHGDVLLTSPVFSVLKQRCPQAKIDAYIYVSSLPMLEGHGAIHEFILYDTNIKKSFFLKRCFYELKLLWKIYRKRYDLVVNLTEGDRGALVAFVSRASVRVGVDPERSGMWGKRFFYTHLAEKCHQIRHTVERDLDVVRHLGIFPTLEERELYFHIPEEAYVKAKELLHEGGIELPGGFVLIHPVSRWLFKCLPETTVAEVIRYLANRGAQVVLSASSDPLERQMNARIRALVPEVPIVDLGGRLSLKELGALIALSKLLICVDSVPLHLASALKAPVVVAFGPTSEITWAPWRNPFARVVKENLSCRPCYRPGCGGSHKSDCLETLSSKKLCEAIEDLHPTTYNLKSSPK